MVSMARQVGDKLTEDWADIEALAPLVVMATERELDDIRKPVALLRRKTIAKTPEAPLSHRNYGLLLTIISNRTDADEAAEQLDAFVEPVLTYLDTTYRHGDAELVGYNNRLAYDIPLTALGKKD